MKTLETNAPELLQSFEHAGIHYQLRTPLTVAVDYNDRIWVYHNADLNLWGYGERREDALSDLHANLAYLWREFAEEKDERLDAKALLLKKRLLALVKK